MPSALQDDYRLMLELWLLGLNMYVATLRHVARLQPEVPATSVLSACCAASDDTPPQRGWRRPRLRHRIS